MAGQTKSGAGGKGLSPAPRLSLGGMENLQDLLLEVLGAHRADLLAPDIAVPVDDVSGGNSVDSAKRGLEVVVAEDDRVVHAVAVHEVLHGLLPLRAVVVLRDADDDEAVRAVPLLEADVAGDLGLAGPAPGR